MTASPRLHDRFPVLDSLRAVGALAVVMTHVGYQSGDAVRGPFAGFLARMDAGVAIFFVISGFLLFRPYVIAHLVGGTPPKVGSYFYHRALRILPVLWIAVAAAAFLLHTPGTGTGDYLQHALLVHIYGHGPLLEGLTQMWSLATEVAFYLALPAIGYLWCRGTPREVWARRSLTLCLVLVVSGGLWMAAWTALDEPIGRLWLPGFLGWFGMGMGLAVWNVARGTGHLRETAVDVVARRPGTVWSLALALFALLSTPLAGPYDLAAPSPGAAATKNILYAVLGLLVVLPAVAPGPIEVATLRHLSGRVGHYLGSISYGVFAYHVVILGLVEGVLGLEPFTGQFWLRLVVTLAVSMAVATASFFVLERPLMRRARRREREATFILEPVPELAGRATPVR